MILLPRVLLWPLVKPHRNTRDRNELYLNSEPHKKRQRTEHEGLVHIVPLSLVDPGMDEPEDLLALTAFNPRASVRATEQNRSLGYVHGTHYVALPELMRDCTAQPDWWLRAIQKLLA